MPGNDREDGDMMGNDMENDSRRVMRTGVCRHCGQVRQVETPADWTEGQVDSLAEEQCGCPAADKIRTVKRRREDAHVKIGKLFGDGAESPVDEKAEGLLHMAVDVVVDWDIEKVTVDIKNGTRGKISRTAKGSIKIERSESRKDVNEVL